MKSSLQPLSDWQLAQAAQTIRSGGVIAYPTEAVWGLGCDPWDKDAVHRILELKQRPMEKGLIVVAGSVAQIDFLLRPLPEAQRQIALSYWPGPVTCLIPDLEQQIPQTVRGRHSSIAVRVSDHPLIKALCGAIDGPLVSTSANPAGRQPARYSWQVRRYFQNRLDRLVPGNLGGHRKPSRIIDIVSGKQLR
ncbi:L-threonylcarbamoyladenylate synthase [Marinobacter sp. CHS3-4]|uniref:L-threonylcarbamoyladenylate synthase n=1 Tax=Marinobacter sp. CHS3-4 TaxID=3045174 RepID=UPI0024B49984|nr:L-threonylcarbamoyladenylate synthase [Marinobacter sp. CHS3-4]MDI9243765.1 L-threonylcarbamoyladenylate synthase [Marinobacter sp. CHS3-4]